MQEFDLDADWDPEAHDKQMAGLYGDGDGSDVDQEKPVWDDDIDVDDIIPPSQPTGLSSSSSRKKKKKKKSKDKDDGDEGGVDIDAMDADIERAYDDEEEWDGTEEMRKRKLDEYMDEVYGLEFNDMVSLFFVCTRNIPLSACCHRLQECLRASNTPRARHRHSRSPLRRSSWPPIRISIST